MKFGRRSFLKGLGSLIAVVPLGLKTRTVPEVVKEPDTTPVKELDTQVHENYYPAMGGCSSFAGPPQISGFVLPDGGMWEPVGTFKLNPYNPVTEPDNGSEPPFPASAIVRGRPEVDTFLRTLVPCIGDCLRCTDEGDCDERTEDWKPAMA